MKSVGTKIIAGILGCSMATAMVLGGIAVFNAIGTVDSNARSIMSLDGQVQGASIDNAILRVEQSVDTLSQIVMNEIDFSKFKQDKNYADVVTEEILDSVFAAAGNTEGAITAYVRYNPDYTNPTSGCFLTRNSTEEDFEAVVPTDFSMYEPTDLEHVGWYYAPVNAGEPIWMDPYLNENIDVYMISYVVPLYAKDGTSIGIVGMDIDFSLITDIADSIKTYEGAYAFIINEQGNVIHHEKIERGTALRDIDESLSDIDSYMEDNSGEMYEYTYDGEDRLLISYELENGMKYAMSVTDYQMHSESNSLIIKIVSGEFMVLLLACIVGIVVGRSISKPVKQLTSVILQTAQLDFTPTKEGSKLRKHKDEIGVMAVEIHNMRKVLRRLVESLEGAKDTILESVENLDVIMQKNNERAEENSAATQELAAGMEETSANTTHIATSIENVRDNTQMIYEFAKNGVEDSKELQKRAVKMAKASRDSSEKTVQMYKVMREKSDIAIEQSAAVARINELTEDIKSISSQTNMLALNASIEAARAGEAGRGFAVVATEIGSLASQTFQTVDNIHEIVSTVNSAVANMTQCIETMVKYLEETVLKDYEEFSKSGNEYESGANTFMGVMENVGDAVKSLEEYVERITVAAEDINTTVAQSAEGINDIAAKSGETQEITLDGYEKLKACREAVDRFSLIVSHFKI